MLKKISFILILAFTVFSISTFTSCNKKDNTSNKDSAKTNSNELVKTDANGQKVSLKMVPKLNDKFHYKMMANTYSTEKGPMTANIEINSEQSMVYYYTQEVTDISSSGYITYKMKYDSITITEKLIYPDTAAVLNQSQTYNSNVKDSVYNKIDFVQYNALAGQEFKFRLSPKGEIEDVTELELIHAKIFKALGDTLKPEEKEKIKQSMGSEAIKAILQNQYQKFPDTEVYKDSSWSFVNETNLSIFPIKNILAYKLKNITVDKNVLLEIEATLGIEFISKEEKQEGMTIKLMNDEAGGKGTVIFDLSRGCIVKKNTNTNINMNLKISAKGQSAVSKQTLKTELTVELI